MTNLAEMGICAMPVCQKRMNSFMKCKCAMKHPLTSYNEHRRTLIKKMGKGVRK